MVEKDIPIIFDKYKLECRIGTGGMAEVYKAQSIGAAGFSRPVVIKKILPHLSRDKEFVDMFVKEATISASLDHPNIVKVYDLGEYKECLFMVLEYIQGKDLATILHILKEQDQPFPPPIAAYFSIDLCKALEVAHNHKDQNKNPAPVIHRDISPQNILISFDGVTKLADFGLAVCFGASRLTRPGVIKGKLGYMSPEQASGLRTIDQRSDIFSVGVVLWEVLSGQRLFTGTSAAEVIKKVRDCNIPFLSQIVAHVPIELSSIIHKALQRLPKDRYQTAGEMRLDFQNYLRKINPPVDNNSVARLLKRIFSDSEIKTSVAEPSLSITEAEIQKEDLERTESLNMEQFKNLIPVDNNNQPTHDPLNSMNTIKEDINTFNNNPVQVIQPIQQNIPIPEKIERKKNTKKEFPTVKPPINVEIHNKETLLKDYKPSDLEKKNNNYIKKNDFDDDPSDMGYLTRRPSSIKLIVITLLIILFLILIAGLIYLFFG